MDKNENKEPAIGAGDALSAYGSFHDGVFVSASRLPGMSVTAVEAVEAAGKFAGSSFLGLGIAVGYAAEGAYGAAKNAVVGAAAVSAAELGVVAAGVVRGAVFAGELGPYGAAAGAVIGGLSVAILGDRAVDRIRDAMAQPSDPYNSAMDAYKMAGLPTKATSPG